MTQNKPPYETGPIQAQNNQVKPDHTDPTPTALQIYADRAEVNELAHRITKMLPSVQQLGNAGALALAQVSISLGLNPFIGELWAIPRKKGGFSLMCGIKGLRRAARIQAKADDGMYVVTFRQVTQEEAAGLRINTGDLIRACDLYLDGRKARAFQEFTGQIPRFTGIGVYRQGEATLMNPIQVARKRAEADALKQAFDLPIGLQEEVEQLANEDAYPLPAEPATRGRHKLLKGNDQPPYRPSPATPPPTRPRSQLFKNQGPPPGDPWHVTWPKERHWTDSSGALDDFLTWCDQERAIPFEAINDALGSKNFSRWPDSVDDCKAAVDAWIADQLRASQDDDDPRGPPGHSQHEMDI